MDNDCDDEISEDVTIQIYVDADMDGYGDSNLFVEVCSFSPDTLRPMVIVTILIRALIQMPKRNVMGLITIATDSSTTPHPLMQQPGTKTLTSMDMVLLRSPRWPVSSPVAQSPTVMIVMTQMAAFIRQLQKLCDGLLNDCTSSFPGAESDDDGDGYIECSPDSAGWYGSLISGGNDCDDGDPIHPAATEICDLIDNDCDQLIDDADTDRVGGGTFYQDNDSDYYGSTISSTACIMPSGYVAASGDCDDNNSQINPGATEVCDSIDNDCDQLIDDSDTSLDLSTATSWFLDNDGDLFGTGNASYACCSTTWMGQSIRL